MMVKCTFWYQLTRGCPGQSPESCKMVVCVCMCVRAHFCACAWSVHYQHAPRKIQCPAYSLLTYTYKITIAILRYLMTIISIPWSLLTWEIGRQLGHYGNHLRPQVADRGTPSRVDKRVAPDREGAADKQCQGEGKLWSQYVITNSEEGKGKPPRLFPRTGYPLGYPEHALSRRLEREREIVSISKNWCCSITKINK